MKKIFLTSGIIVCMACPAFATGIGFPADAQTGAVPSGIQSGACTEPKLGVYEGDTTLSAIWQVNYVEMKLNKNIGTTAPTGGAENTTYEPALFLVGGNGVYTRSGDSDTDYAFTKVNTGDTALTTLPAGIDVNYTLHTDKPTGATGTVSGGTSTAKNRAFLGFYADTDTTVNGGTPFIGSDGKLTAAGNTAATGYDNTAHQWKAKYEHVHPTVVDPELYGYTFKGWAASAEDATAGTVIANFADDKIGENTHRYASWKANTYTVEYKCGDGATGTAPADATATYDASFTWAGNNDTAEGTGCKKAGHHFTGWTCKVATTGTVDGTEATIITNGGVSCSANATGVGDCTGNEVTKWTEANLQSGATITCTAQFSASSITITWDDNDGNNNTSVSGGTPTCTYGADVTLPTAPTRTGYTFKGWKVAND